MNKFKKLATLCMALMLSVGVSVFAACNNSASSSEDVSSDVESVEVSSEVESEGEEEAEPTDCYKLIIVDEEGNPIPNVQIQLCEAENPSVCFMPIKANADGICYYGNGMMTIANMELSGFSAGAWEIHVLDAGYTLDRTVTPTTYGEVSVVLKAS